eukprot:4209846-Pleurochrysis_carterae.AAC.2
MPGEGAIPATVTGAGHFLLASLRARIEDIVGEERVGAVRTEVRELAEAVLTLDLKFRAVVRLLGGCRPSGRAHRAASMTRTGCTGGGG